MPAPKDTVFARQVMPRAMRFSGGDDETVVKELTQRIDVMVKRGNRQSGSWTMHAFAIDDDDGLARARAIGKRLMAHVRERQPEFSRRYINTDAFAEGVRQGSDFVLQIYVPAQDDLWFSAAPVSEGLSLFEAGFQRMKTLRGAPSRSASKLEEALSHLGERPVVGQTAVDLGAAPGGWSFVLARHGATVYAVDHAKLDVKAFVGLKGRVEHVVANGLTYTPPIPVDWLVCDMVMGARDSLAVLRQWLEASAMRRFIVNIKLPSSHPWPQVLDALELLAGCGWAKVTARHLLHDRSEITLMGLKVKN
jgi:23S rRNA C2498 (ribose-2'-O)-methylase RlmM